MRRIPYPNNLRLCIKLAGFTFREVHEELDIPESTLYDWAAGNRVIPRRERKRLAALLGCSQELLAPTVFPGRSVSYLIQCPQETQEWLEQQGDTMDKTRRILSHTLAALAGMALFSDVQSLLDVEPWRHLTQAVANPAMADPDTLARFGKLVEACWHLSNGTGLEKVEQLLPTFLPHLSTLAEQSGSAQRQAASIAAQGHMLGYIIAYGKEDFKAAFVHTEQARTYAELAGDKNLQGAALIRQGGVWLYRKRPYQSLKTYEEALRFVGDLSPLVQARLYACFCEVQGKLGMEEASHASIGRAQESFARNTKDDPALLYIHFGQSGLYLHEGLALVDLHKPQQALDALLHIDGMNPKLSISERSRLDVLNQQTRAAGDKGDLEQFQLYLEATINGARAIGSELRYSEAWDTYKHVHANWKREPQIQRLHTLFAQ